MSTRKFFTLKLLPDFFYMQKCNSSSFLKAIETHYCNIYISCHLGHLFQYSLDSYWLCLSTFVLVYPVIYLLSLGFHFRSSFIILVTHIILLCLNTTLTSDFYITPYFILLSDIVFFLVCIFFLVFSVWGLLFFLRLLWLWPYLTCTRGPV